MSEALFAGQARADAFETAFEMRLRLSVTEQIVLAFFAYITAAALVFHLPMREVGTISALSVITFATLAALRRNRHRAPWLAAAADLFPALLILVAYRESGLLLTPDSSHHLDHIFVQWDRVLLRSGFVQAVLQAGAPWLQHYLEFAYLLCYPLVPLGVVAVHFTSRQKLKDDGTAAQSRVTEDCSPAAEGAMDRFWTTVLLATLCCYAIYPYFPLTPPRVLFGDVPGPHVEPLLRKLNFWLLDHYSVQACIFPSGHVAAVTAVALAVRRQAPRLGALFLFLAASVALATVYGRYHYTADAVAGALVGIGAYQVSKLLKPFERLN